MVPILVYSFFDTLQKGGHNLEQLECGHLRLFLEVVHESSLIGHVPRVMVALQPCHS